MRWIYIYHLYELIVLVLIQLRLVDSNTSYPVIMANNYSITYDSTTKDIYSYYKSQGLIVADKIDPSDIKICHYDNQFNLFVEESIKQIYLYLKVEYIFSNSVEYEYIIAFNNERLRGQRIPVIDSSNNVPGTESFFYNSIYIFQMSYTFTDSIKPASTDMLGVQFTHNQSNSSLIYYLCLNQGIYVATITEGIIQSQLSFTKYTQAQNYISGTACKSIIKQNYDTVLINQDISCNPTGCTKFTQTLNTSVFLDIQGIIKQPLQSINYSTWTITPYSWTNIPILYAFQYHKVGTNTLYILPDPTNQMILINIRDQNDNQIFVGQLQGITSLDDKFISYNTLGLYVIEKTKKVNAQIISFCIDSTFSKTVNLCVKTTDSNCQFENNSQCLQCMPSTYLNPTTQACLNCPKACSQCISATVCTSCISDYRDPNNSCQCIGGRVESQNARFLSEKSNKVRNLQATLCICPISTYEDPTTKNCIKCSTISSFCQACNSQGCTSCSIGSYLKDNTCFSCLANCTSCIQNECLQCSTSYYIDATKQCSACSSLVQNCIQCTSTGCSQCANGYYLYNNQCIQCSSNCQNGCQSGTVCNSCYTSRRDINNNCACIGGTTEEAGSISGQGQCLCQSNQYFDTTSNTCKLCSASFGSTCLTCSQSGCLTCDQTSGAQYINSQTKFCISCSQTFGASCLQCTETGCLSCDQTNGAQYIDSQTGACKLCNQNFGTTCLSCSQSGCTQCDVKDGAQYIDSQTKSCILCTKTFGNTCLQCTQNECTNCDSTNGAKYFDPNTNTCKLCNQNFGSTCLQCSKSGCSKCDEQNGAQYIDQLTQSCQYCNASYGSFCQQCTSDGCTQCDSTGGAKYFDPNTKVCKLCSQDFGSTCLSCSKSGCSTCDQSSEAQYIDSKTNSCVACSATYGSDCESCNSTQCTKCRFGFYLNEQKNQCLLCNSNCKDGCSSSNQCTSCYTQYRDPSQQCNCVDGRHSIPDPNQNVRLLSFSNSRFLSSTDICICNSDRVKLADGQCQLCSSLFGSQCNSCNLQTCLNCINGSYPNQTGVCQCPSDYYLDQPSSTCIQCITQYSQYCKSCNSSTCLDCGDTNSQYIQTTKACQCKEGFYVSSRVNNSFTCQICSQKYGSNCTICNETTCQNCQSGFMYNASTQQCECPTGYTVKDNKCQQCTILYNKYCSQCDAIQCNTCSQSERNPATNCSCKEAEAVDLNDQCYLCSINLSTQASVALATIMNANVVCNFQTQSDVEPQSNAIQGSISIYLALSYNFVDTLGVIQKNTNNYLLSNSFSIQNFVLPHGNHKIISNFTAFGTLAFTQISTISISVSTVYSNMQQLYINYFSFKSLTSKLNPAQIITYLAEILQIKIVQSDNISIQQNNCSSISQNGSICSCKSASSFFADCSGTNSQYSQFQKIMLLYSSFLNDKSLTLTKLQQIQFNYLIPLVNEQMDSTFLSKDSTQVDTLVNTIQQQTSQFSDVTNLPSNFSQQATQVTEQISGLLDSPSISQENTQKAMKIVTQVQQAALQTINPFNTQVNKPDPIPQISTNNLLLDQKLVQCSTSDFTVQNIQYLVGDSFSSSQNNRFLGINPQISNQPTLQIRILDSSKCQVIATDSQIDKSQYYNGISASVYKSNPYQNVYDLPYKEQRYSFFTTQLKYFDSSTEQNKKNRVLDSTSQNLNQNQLYSLNFKIIDTNPQDNSTNFNYTMFKCIYLNQSSESTLKWAKCASSFFLAQSRTLGCNCPVESTYVYDYDNIFTDDSTNDLIEDAKKKQTTLIIIAIILAAVFILLIILYAFIYKPKHIVYEIAQLGKQQELLESNQVKINEKMQIVKAKDFFNEENKKFGNIISAQSTPLNQIIAQQAQQQLKNKNNYSPNNTQNQQAHNFTINSNNNNNLNNIQYSSAKFNQNQKFDTFGNNSSYQQNKKIGNSFQDNQEVLNSHNRSLQLHPSIFNNINKLNTQHYNLAEIPLSSVNERREYLQTFENNYTERIPQDQQNSEKKLEEMQTHNYLRTNANTNRDIQSNVKLQGSNSEENIEVSSKIHFTSQNLSKQGSSSQSQKKDLKIQEEKLQ